MARRKTLKTFVSITSKSSASGEEKAVQENVHMRMYFESLISFNLDFHKLCPCMIIGNIVYC
jgi:hypothetical protein